MRRAGFILCLLLLATGLAAGQSSQQKPKRETWYEFALRQINPKNADFAALWEQRKRALMNQVANRYFQYGLGATAVIVVLLTVTCVQHVSHRRSLHIAAQSIADVVGHDESSRQIAREAIRRHNEHIEACNRIIETRQEG